MPSPIASTRLQHEDSELVISFSFRVTVVFLAAWRLYPKQGGNGPIDQRARLLDLRNFVVYHSCYRDCLPSGCQNSI